MSLLGGLRRRLTLSLIAVAAVTVLVVGSVSVILVDRSLRARLADEVVAVTEFNLAILAPAAGLNPAATVDDIIEIGLLERFLRRGVDGVWVEDPEGRRSTLAPGLGPISVSEQLRVIAERGEIGYEFADSDLGLVVVTAARYPGNDLTFYFVTRGDVINDATRSLLAVVTGVGLVAILIATLVAAGLARRVLQPVRAARRAAERMAEGDLEVRLQTGTADELGGLSAAFNEMAASLQATIDQLETARARERRFTADVSHELRTPVTSLVNAARMLLERLRRRGADDDLALATLLDEEVNRLRHLVEDLLEISRLDSENIPRDPTPVDVGAFLAALARARHPDARVEVAADGPVLTEPRSLERIVGNLLDNARNHAPGAEATLSASVADASLVIEVADRGPGVDPEALPTLFDRFATADPSRQGGTGLGLAIAVQHARRLGGDVTAALRPGGGMVFVVTVPVGQLLHAGDDTANGEIETGGRTHTGDPQ